MSKRQSWENLNKNQIAITGKLTKSSDKPTSVSTEKDFNTARFITGENGALLSNEEDMLGRQREYF